MAVGDSLWNTREARGGAGPSPPERRALRFGARDSSHSVIPPITANRAGRVTRSGNTRFALVSVAHVERSAVMLLLVF